MRRGHIDDAPPSPLLHRRERMANRVERGDEVDRDDRVPLIDRELLDRRDVLDAGIVDEDVDRAELAGSFVLSSASIASALLISALSKRTTTPCISAIRVRSASISAGSPKPFKTILQPCAANSSAIPSPMPLVDPVTSTVFPSSMTVSSCRKRRLSKMCDGWRASVKPIWREARANGNAVRLSFR